MNFESKKICLVASSLGKGGAERSVATLSKVLTAMGHEIHIVTVLNNVEYEYEGSLFNLGELKEKNDTVFGRVSRLLAFKKYLKEHQFDVIVDNRTRGSFFREFILASIIYKPTNTVFVVHSSRLSNYFFRPKWLAELVYKNYQFVTVSKAINNLVNHKYGIRKIETIYNAMDFNLIDNSTKSDVNIENEFVLFYGRLVDKVKNVKFLIKAYSMSDLPNNDISLMLIGDGPDESMLKHYTAELNMNSHITFLPKTSNPFPYVKAARAVLLTSHYEGFPMVLPEALSCGTPVVSVDCESGPNEVIIHGKNGLLVGNYEIKGFVNALNSIIFDKTLYQQCKQNARSSVEHLSMESIGNQWQQLLKSI